MDFAAQGGLLKILQYLIETIGAQVETEPNKKSLLYWGLKSKNVEVCRYIISKVNRNNVHEVFQFFQLSRDAADLNYLEHAIKQGSNGVNDLDSSSQTLLQST